MTPEQITTFAAHIETNTNQTIIDALAIGNNNAIVSWYNQEASPVVWVFKNDVDTDTANKSIDWSEYIDLTPNTGTTIGDLIDVMEQATLYQRRDFALQRLLANGSYDPSVESNRDALIEIFPPSMPNTRAAWLADATRHATYAEAIFIQTASGPAGGDGSAQNQAAIALFVGDVTLQNVRDAVAIINA